MEFTHWYLVIGALLILLVLTQGGVNRMPITTAMLYLGLGWFFGVSHGLSVMPLTLHYRTAKKMGGTEPPTISFRMHCFS